MANTKLDDELAQLAASLSNSVLAVSRGPIGELEAAAASPAGAVGNLATISNSLSQLASFASMAASLASLMHRLRSVK